MKVTVNGEPLEIDPPVAVPELLRLAGAEQPEYVSVQINGEFVRREDFASTWIKDGDAVEFLYFMGGGRR